MMSIPIILSTLPFGLLFGAVAAENGLSTGQAVLMSATVYAGASQMVGLDLFGQRVPAWMIVLSIFAVNFRHLLYSAALGPRIAHWGRLRMAFGFFFLVDPQFAESEKRGGRGRVVEFAWYMGLALPVYVAWVAVTALGARFGSLIEDPEAFGLDYMLPIFFISLLMGFRDRPPWLAVVALSAAAALAAYLSLGSPWHVSAGALGGVAGAMLLAGRKDESAR